MANIEKVAGGAGLNGTWARDLERDLTPAGRSKAAKGRPRVEPHERCRASAPRFRRVAQLGQAAKMPGGGSVTAHARIVIEEPCTNDPRGDARDVPVEHANPGWEAPARRREEKPQGRRHGPVATLWVQWPDMPNAEAGWSGGRQPRTSTARLVNAAGKTNLTRGDLRVLARVTRGVTVKA